jgi:deoxyribodipyrimidine photo-lyase
MIQDTRISSLNSRRARKGSYVLYWMQASPRVRCNHALEYAIIQANRQKKPLIVYFALTETYPGANLRHYRFLIEGLREVESGLAQRGIQLKVQVTEPVSGVCDLASDASLLVGDRGYLRHHREWRESVAEQVRCPFMQVETNAVVPVGEASVKEEWSAATFRRKISPLLKEYLVPLKERVTDIPSLHREVPGRFFDLSDDALSRLDLERSVEEPGAFRGGETEAHRHLGLFIRERLNRYDALRNDPNADVLSNMSPYLHFGQISPLDIARAVKKSGNANAPAYLEELVVRRELALNFVHYNERYDSWDGLPGWAQKTLLAHANDSREYEYSAEEFEQAQTHDPYWNAAQIEMMRTGKLHGYMRMYWGKKFIEWTQDPKGGFALALRFNDAYELDGRDPNGYAGVAWCFGKHDRPWKERPIFGTIRYMNANGLKRKFDADAYVDRIGSIEQTNPHKR